MSAFAIIQEEYGGVDPEAVAPILEARLGLVRFDAAKQAREGRGILAEGVDAAAAEALVRDFAALGVPVRRFPQEYAIRIGKPAPVRTVYVTEEALHVVEGYEGEPRPIPWEYLWLLSAAELAEARQVQSGPGMSARRIAGIRWGLSALAGPVVGRLIFNDLQKDLGRFDSATSRRDTITVHLADVFTGTPEGEFRHFRLRSRDLYYDRILGEQASRDWFGNFRLVLAHLASRASRAVVTPGLRALALGEEDLSAARFGTEAEFTQYNRWQLQWLALAARGAS